MAQQGPADTRPRKITQNILGAILKDQDAGTLDRIADKIRELTEKGLDRSLKDGGCIGLGEVQPAESSVMLNNAFTAARAEEVLQAIRHRQITMAMDAVAVEAALDALEKEAAGVSESRPTEVIIRYADGVEPRGNPIQQAAKPGSRGA